MCVNTTCADAHIQTIKPTQSLCIDAQAAKDDFPRPKTFNFIINVVNSMYLPIKV